ncbi:DDE-type integrase/transposase/recombinase, partial [Gammaproteobacteria bacterium]|nr:DDE-type integrase/transposase/recombinase [Gammaproteobacteria bacterium]
NQVWQVDIIYIRTRKGFVYLTALIDVYSRYLLGFSVSNTLDTDSCIDSLNQALQHGHLA